MSKYLALPSEITPFERRFLKHLNKIALIFFYLHIPVLMGVAALNDTRPLLALALSLFVLIGPTIAYATVRNPRSISVVYGITGMLIGGLLVHFGQGPLQIEMHFYFFALLAMLCMFANPAVNLAAAVTVALHHLLVWWFLPSSVFNYNAQWWVVLVHAAFVVLETVAACYISRQFFDNVIGLEKIVEARTVTVREQQRDIRSILDNLEEGLVTIDLAGRICGDASRSVTEWFGDVAAGEKLSSWLGRKDPVFAEWLELGLEGLNDGILPVEVSLAQLPKRFNEGEKTYSVKYQLMGKSNEVRPAAESPELDAIAAQELPNKILIIVSDVTELLAREAAKRYQNDFLEVFQHLLRDRAGFIEFLAEADAVVESLKNRNYDSLEHLKRLIHTLKGNTAIFGMQSVSEVCNRLENLITEQEAAPTAGDLAELDKAWWRIRSDIRKLMGEGREKSIEVDHKEYKTVLSALHGSVDLGSLARMIESWQLEPAANRLDRVKQQINRIAERMGKNVSVSIEPNDLRINSEWFAPFWAAFIHVLRNTVDHGVEPGEEREKFGKPAQASIRICTSVEGDRFVVSIEDDGPGIDWERLEKKASELGLLDRAPLKTVEFLCLPGLSSKEEVTEVSGRGVGMSALADACGRLQGNMQVQSKPGVGTCIRFVFPKETHVYERQGALLNSAPSLALA